MLEHRGSVWRHAPAALGTTLLVAAAVVGTQVALAQAGNPRAPLSPYGEGGFTVGAAAVDKRVTITSADDGSYVLGYTPAGGDVVLDLDMLSGNSVQPWWYDPRTGRTLKMRTLDSEGVARFPVPKEGGGPSWVLVVDDVAAGYGAPDPDVVAQATGKNESGGATGKDASTGTTGQAASSIGSTGSGSSGTGSSGGGDGGTSGSDGASGATASGTASGGTDPSSTDGSTTENGDSGDSGDKDTSDTGQDGGSTTDGGSENDGDAQKDGDSEKGDSEKDDSKKDDSQSDGGSTQDGSGGSGSDASGGDQAGEKDSGEKDGSGDGGGEPGAGPASGSTPEEGRFGDDGTQKDQGDAQKQDGGQKDGDQQDAGKDQSDAGKKDETGPVAPEPTKEPEKPAALAKDTTPAADGSWDKLATCESSGDWAINTGNGYYGGLQFDSATWSDFGGTKYAPRADKASKEQQIEIASKVRDARGGYSSWPACSSKLGLPK